jgi:indole-3-glycerol phosphate synthase
VVIKPDLAMWDEAHAHGLECVVRVTESSQLEHALHYFDPEVFLLSVAEDADDDPLTVLLELLHDVPAGKLAIAELHDATPDDVSELERSGIDAVLVSPGGLETLIQTDLPEV